VGMPGAARHDDPMSSSKHRLIRLVMASLNDIEEWRLGDAALARAKGYPREYPAEVIDDWGIVFVDVVLDAVTGRPFCHEVNGPNAVGSDALTGDSRARAESEARQALQRARERGYLDGDGRLLTPAVSVHAHQHWKAFRTGGEFFPRVEDFAELMDARLGGSPVCLRGAGEPLGDEMLSVVLGDVPAVARHLVVDPATQRLGYRGRPLIFAGNPNLLPELVRTRKVAAAGGRATDLDLRVFHAWRLVHLVHDKGRQQELLEGTGIEPLPYFEAASLEEARICARALLAGGPVVVKPNGASGGTGVHVVVPGMTDAEIADRIEAVIADCARKYGDNAEASAFPIRGFPFVRSTGYPMSDGDHLWDLRIAVQFEPGRAAVYPVTLRLAPRPFDPRSFHRDRDQWISNVSGRQETLLKSGMDDRALAAVGLSPDRLEQIFRASVRWTMKAWDASARDGGRRSAVHEDACESDDRSFYPVDKFTP